jgi:hypothetical protein
VYYHWAMSAAGALRVLCWGTYDTSKPRTRILRDGLRAAGATVQECHAPVWGGSGQVPGRGSLRTLALLVRCLACYPA